jgi:FKBP-type peptidyl-prolyl cis-trans isomerases 1
MKKITITLIAILLSMSYCFCQTPAAYNPTSQQAKFSNFTDSVSYAYGVAIAKNMENYRLNLNNEVLFQAIKDVRNKIILFNDTTVNLLLAKLQSQIQTKEKARIEVLAKENATKSNAFFEGNARKPNIKTTASGLQYEEVVKGPIEGTSPTINDTVVVNFEAKFIDGKPLDSSYSDGKPIHMPLGQIIAGLQEGLLLMKPKDTFILYIPSNLAYGEKGNPTVEPNQGLIFKVELVDIIRGSAPLPQY